MAEISILDVGHGNSAVCIDDGAVVVVDVGQRETLLEFLEQRGVTRINALMISHSDDDHLGGAPNVLLDPNIHVVRVLFNTDGQKDTRSWLAFRAACVEARKRKGTRITPHLTTDVGRECDLPNIRVDVLLPEPETAGSGPGTTAPSGNAITTNSMSAVIRLSSGGVGAALFFADADQAALDTLTAASEDIAADVLVYPHHGGLQGTNDPVVFAEELIRAVQPKLVVFSIGRGLHGNPRPEVVRAVRASGSNVRIACTQLSESCAAATPLTAPRHLNAMPARGRAKHACCAGTITITVGDAGTTVAPLAAEHLAFIQLNAPTSLCHA